MYTQSINHEMLWIKLLNLHHPLKQTAKLTMRLLKHGNPSMSDEQSLPICPGDQGDDYVGKGLTDMIYTSPKLYLT